MVSIVYVTCSFTAVLALAFRYAAAYHHIHQVCLALHLAQDLNGHHKGLSYDEDLTRARAHAYTAEFLVTSAWITYT
jgi:hypothetical protein